MGQDGYVKGLLVYREKNRGSRRISRTYGKKKKGKEEYEEYFKELDKIFNECEYDEKQVEEEEKKNEEEMDLLCEKDLLEINFCNFENDPRSLANLVKNKSEDELEKEKLEEEEKKRNKEKDSLEYSYDYDRIFKKKKFLQEKVDYKDRFSLKEDQGKLIEHVDTHTMNDFLNNYKNDFSGAFYKGRRDSRFGREDLFEGDDQGRSDQSGGRDQPGGLNQPGGFDQPGGLNQPVGHDQSGGHDQPGELDQPGGHDQSGELDQPGGHDQSGELDQPGGHDQSGEGSNDVGSEQMESIHFLRRIRDEFHLERDNYVSDSVKQIEKQYETAGNGESYSGEDVEGGSSFQAYLDKRMKNCDTNGIVHNLIVQRFEDMFGIDEEVRKINEKIKKSENVGTILDIFKKEKRINIINIMYAFMYIYRIKSLNIREYLYDRRFIYLTDSLEEIMKHYLFVINKKDLLSGTRRTLVLNDRNIQFLMKYMNRLKLFYLNLNIYNMLFLILSHSFDLFTPNSLIILLAYLNEYTYFTNNIHKKINLAILDRIYNYLENNKYVKTSKLNFGHFQILVPILIKYKYINNSILKQLFRYYENDINRIITSVKEDSTLLNKNICDTLFYDAKTKDQKKNKQNYFSYLTYQHIMEKKKNLHFLSTLLHYLLISKFDDSDKVVLNLVNMLKDHFHLFHVDEMLNIFFNYELFKCSNKEVMFRCKQELLHRKSLLTDLQINKILSYIVFNFRNGMVLRDYHRVMFTNRRYTIRRVQGRTNAHGEEDLQVIQSPDDTSLRGYTQEVDTSLAPDNSSLGEGEILKELLRRRKDMRSFRRSYLLCRYAFEDPQFLYDLTHDIHIFVNFRNVHLLKFVYNMYQLSLLFYKNADVLRIVSEIAYNLTDTNIFSFIDQYGYYMYEDVYIMIKTLKYISFFDIELIDIWKKFFFLLHHFVNSLNLEDIYDIFFFIKIAKLSNLKCENYDVFKLLTNRMREIVHILFQHDINIFSTHPHTYILNILSLIRERQNEHVQEFARFFFYAIYKKLEQGFTSREKQSVVEGENENVIGMMKKLNEMYKKVNNFTYNFRDVRIFLNIFLSYYKEGQEKYNFKIVDFILYNSEIFFSEMSKNKYYYHSSYVYGSQMNEYLSLLNALLQKKMYNSIVMRRYITIFKYILSIQSVHNNCGYTKKNSLYANFFSHFAHVTDVNVWRFARRHLHTHVQLNGAVL
ncbi:conserved Plasmodium protein, unknown function [Plasmodium ovale]|uniref:Uncharacterized protein n=1 Tax=Plasmodium ovale TaxID=36330 RepID=A0A1C3KQM8_PLAOA|nr:conserved Plasmodium protein, unknown function [Plasmodium ovale]